MSHDVQAIRQIYEHRFTPEGRDEKRRVWAVLVRHFFQRWIAPDAAVLDIGCGFGEFLNHVACGDRVGIDLNPEAAGLLVPGIAFHCRAAGDLSFLEAERFDIVFVSNFLEHLEDKHAVEDLLRGIHRVLRPRGQSIILGPNLRFLPGLYWDYWDHYVPITDRSLVEVLGSLGFQILESRARFLPYTVCSRLPTWPMLVWLYLKSPWVWPFLGRQFFVRAARAGS